jgi:hypothetical protein
VISPGRRIFTQRPGTVDNLLVNVGNGQLKIEIVQRLTADRL